jgi:hypothetical protein
MRIAVCKQRCATLTLFAATVLLSGCGSTLSTVGGGPSGDVVVVDEKRRDDHHSPRGLKGVPPGHYSPPGLCRLWYAGRPPGHQPRPTKCANLIGKIPAGAFILYNDKAWDTSYNWRTHARRHPGTVPVVIIDLTKNVHDD